MRKGLLTDFEAIRRELPVDWKVFKKRLIQAGANAALIDSAVIANVYSEKEYRVSIIDEEAFEALRAYALPNDKSSRSAASKSGNSHATRVNGALLAAWGIEDATPYNRLFIPGQTDPRPTKRHALIIENLECFLNKEQTYLFAQSHCGVTESLDDVEYIWAAGNSISNKLIIPYLKAFDGAVMCLLDVDLGGLKIYGNLLSGGLSVESTRYLIPHDLKDRLAASRRKATEKELEALSGVYGMTLITDKVVGAIRFYKTTIEQESYRVID